MKPLIKWPGGKSSEFQHIEHIIPQYHRYIEPFFGGGAIYFNLPVNKTALINDISPQLMKFYYYVKTNNNDFRNALYDLNTYWSEVISEYFRYVFPELSTLYNNYRCSGNQEESVDQIKHLLSKNRNIIFELFDNSFFIEPNALYSEINQNLIAKITRMATIEKQAELMSDKDVKDNLETGIRSGFYMLLRRLYNDILLNRPIYKKLSNEEEIAVFYFVREYCYGSMFRYNSSGEFNIPYGGIAYNKKDFKRKIDHLFSQATLECFANTDIYNQDFEEFLNIVQPQKDDFIFLDPPYDSDFSDYEGLAFGKRDQERLASYLCNTTAKFILIIKSTEYILNLYKDCQALSIFDFDKQYTYNVRSRNNRKVNHLIITNCK